MDKNIIKDAYKRVQKREHKLISNMYQDNLDYRLGLICSGNVQSDIAILELILNDNLTKSKSKFSQSVILKLCKSRKLPFMSLGNKPMYGNTLFDAIFSNNQEVINELNDRDLLGIRVDYDPDSSKDISEYPIHPLLDQNHQFESFMQNLLFYDGDGLEKNKEILLGYKQTRKSKWKGYDDWTIDMINAYQTKDIDAISKLTNKRADMRKKWEANDWYGKSYFGTAFAKLAVMNGYDIKIESPYIVQELLDTTPLDSYETYDWLEVLYHEGYDAYVEKFVKPHQNKNKGGFFNKLFGKN